MAALQASALSAAMRASGGNGTMDAMYDPDPLPMLVPAIVASGPPSHGPRDDGGLFVSGSTQRRRRGHAAAPAGGAGERAAPRVHRASGVVAGSGGDGSMPAPPSVVSRPSGAAWRSVPGSARPRRASCSGPPSAPTTTT